VPLVFDDPEILVRMAAVPPSPEQMALGEKFAKEIETDYGPKGSVRFVSEKSGHGFFVEEDLTEGSFAGEYLGVVTANDKHDGINDYLYQYPVLDDIGRNYVIDAKLSRYPVRYINHSFKPNLKPYVAFFKVYHIILLAIRPIKAGAQLCYDYGESYWYIRSPPELL
jgi:SET domain-containing protein